MHKFTKYLAIVIFSLFTLPAFAIDDAVSTGIFNNTAIDGYDTVAYFKQGKAVEGDKKFQFSWRDANWRFSSQENLQLFKQDPEKYAAQYGGYCAWAMANGKTAGIDPYAWHIEDGKLYLNYNKKIKSDWLSTMAADIDSANKHYPEITDVKKYINN
ncbi:YHS domain-containing (seleno)protein [uncultured Paraglaciecola sp.]|uniref:YHS domain-containing (seleno)protein n=1 Tax=uncultured Paraglaciecola sp. TaxID=1765024 RepID=UPI0030DDDE9C|tara:strand:- start:477576 stop:478046 length:471 start_codon:yes stop_codon:yes gene_type:complete